MAITYHTLPSGNISDTTSYQGQLWMMLCQFECAVGGTPDIAIYDDGKADSVDKNGKTVLGHNPTIGVGFNLRAQLLPVMQAYFGQSTFDTSQSGTNTQDQSLMASLKTVMAESWSGDANVTARTTEVVNAINAYYAAIAPVGVNPTKISTFSLTQAQIQTAFTSISVAFEKEVIGYDNIPQSNERLALMSLAWNSQGTPLDGKNLLGKGLKAALDTGNRAAAWFQIRYNSNGDANDGIAKRRYFESQLFGLYNEAAGAAIPQDEALQTYEMMSESNKKTGVINRNVIFNYEASYGDKDVNAANTDYHGVLGITVQTLAQALQPAADTLIQQYTGAATNPYLTTNPFSASSISALDVQVATAAGGHDTVVGSDLVASSRNGYQLGTGSPLSSLLIAQGGNDTLDASASSANDVLIGGTGDDTILGGTGDDYIVAGTGNDLITLIGGNDTVVLGDANNPLDGKHDTVDASHDVGNVTYIVGAGTQESIMLGSGSSLIELVSAQPGAGVSLKTLSISAYWIGPGEWYDPTHNALLIQQANAAGLVDPNAAAKNIKIIYGAPAVASGSTAQSSRLALAQLQQVAASGVNSSQTVIELTLDGFTGSSDDGITIGAAPAASTLPGGNNLSQLQDEGLVGDTTPGGDAKEIYEDSIAGALVGTINGADSSANAFGNEIIGDGNASFISAGNGNNTVLLGNFYQHAIDPTATALNAIVQGGSGNQTLIGVGNGAETITGGAVGTDTSAITYIDGGGATADLIGGGQTSVIFGGTGADTLEASLANSSSSAGFDPLSVAIAGLSFWGDAYSSQSDANDSVYDEGSLPRVSWSVQSPGDVQINLALYQTDGTYAAAFDLLGSSLDSGTSDSTTLPGSFLIGGTGQNYLIGNRGNDTIVGGSPTNAVSGMVDGVLVGGAGADVIYGGGGTEIIYADLGPGNATGWADLDADNADTIYGGSGTDFIYGSGGDDVIYGGSGADVINVGNGNSYVAMGSGTSSVYGGSGNDTIVADGATAYIETGAGDAYIEIANGLSTILGGSGSDTLQAGAGNALITEGSGATTLIVGVSTGSDTIQGSSGGTTIQLTDGLTETTLVARDVNGDLVLSDTGFAAQITVNGYFNSPAGVALQFADGTTWNAAEILQASITASADGSNDTLVGSSGSDSITAGFGDTSIVGVSGSNTLTGGAGNDTIQGGSGTDTIEGGSGTTQIVGGTGTETYVFNLGDGSDTIQENLTSTGSDVLHLGAGISASDLSFSYDSTSNILQIGFGSTSDATMTIANFVATQAGQHEVNSLVFADGSSLSQQQIIQLGTAIDGTTGNDYLIGTSGTNYFDGKGGNDHEYGDGGNDTFVFNAGYGDLEVNDFRLTDQQTVLQLGAGITAAALRVTSDSNDLILTDGITGDQVFLDNMWASGSEGVSLVQLADGTTLTAAQLIQMEETGTIGNDTLYGTANADLIDGKGGDDLEQGEGGSDTFVFNAGYGQLEIYDNYNGDQQPVLQLGAGIASSSLHVTSDGSNLFLTDGLSGDQVELDSMVTYSGYGVALVELADGTAITATQLLQMLTTGTTGNDSLVGTYSDNLFDGKGGNDFEEGNGGNDTFVFNAGYGDLDIYENYSSGQQPVLQLGPGITAAALDATADGSNLVLTDGVSGDQVTLIGMLSKANGANYGVTLVKLADGTTLTAAQLVQLETTGTTGNNTLVGTSGAELFDGSGGYDVEQGNGGNDTFVFNAGYGHLEINENYANGDQPLLQLGAGITAAALRVTSSDYGYGLTLTDSVSGDQITIDDMLVSNSAAGYGVTAVTLADGTSLTAAQLIRMETTGTTSGDTLYGTAGADLFDGKGGDDVVIGKGGNDTFVFNAGYGNLEINETYASDEQAVLQLGDGITASALHVTTDGTNLFLTDGISGDQVELDNGVRASGVAVVTLADGTSLTEAQLLQLLTVGTSGNDTLYGTSGADFFDGKGGDDYAIGNGGSDTFVFNQGYGILEINAYNTSAAPAVLQLGAGITEASLKVSSNNSGALILTDGVNGDMIYVDEALLGNGSEGVQEVEFSDGTTLPTAQLIQMAREINGTTGNDTLQSPSSSGVAYVFDGKGGYDLVKASGAFDTFVFDAGYGHLEINNVVDSTLPQAVLQLGAGITSSALHVATNGTDLVLTDAISGDQVTMDDMWLTYDPQSISAADFYGIGSVQFADGTALTAAQLVQMEMTGTTGSDTIVGTAGADLIDGKGGNDFVAGNGGNDTFVFDSGYGHLSIDEFIATNENFPILKFGSGITSSSLRVKTNGSQWFLSDGISGDQITLSQEYSSDGFGITAVQFADGSTLTAAQLMQMELTGTTGDEAIYGTQSADFIDGKGGDDSVVGNGGNDSFVFNSGYGHLAINETYTSGQAPVLQLGAGITDSTLKVETIGDDLVFTDGVAGDQITLTNMSSSSTSGVATVTLASGTSLTRAQLIQMETTSNSAAQPVKSDSAAVAYFDSSANAISSNAGSDNASSDPASPSTQSAALDPMPSGQTNQASNQTIGTANNDILQGSSGAELFDGKGGVDEEVGAGGSDTFVFNAGYGELEIDETFANGQAPVLQFGAGITEASLHVSTDGKGNLFLSDAVTGDDITLVSMLSKNVNGGVATLQFADGTTLTAAQLEQRLHPTTGTTGNDTLSGTSGMDYFDGKGGIDEEVGEGGSDTFVFNAGYGELAISETYTSGQDPVLQLGAGISAASLLVSTDGSNLFLTDGIAGDEITLDNAISESAIAGVQTVQFVDGTTLTIAQLEQRLYPTTGTTGNDTLSGTSGMDYFDGKGGIDEEVGEGGSDTFVFNAGYGDLEINETYASGQAPVLQFGAGITAASLHVSTDGKGNLFLADGITGDEITLVGMSSNNVDGGVADVDFVDGTTLTAAQLVEMESPTSTTAAANTPTTPGSATSSSTASAQINALIHAMASYTGHYGGEGGIGSLIAAPVAHDLMLHAAAA